MEIILHLLRSFPDLEIDLVTVREKFLTTLSLSEEDSKNLERLCVRKKDVDVGMIQKDSLSIDIRATEKNLRNSIYRNSIFKFQKLNPVLISRQN
ncbi:hypothetical protein LEP1GSC133_4646 [Leptospira borgpetersenii serovar Pomona str. 200901868]|uniref:Uncharacterized protein n=2 Tax=Leptospira borgpetersenii TaxID=174 RepID=M3GG02_LEPBO|nr:hypothetical protein LEP1GSC123_2817 [Leptospira borgpetersenii str. 200701203]EMO10279.1 hypothetical protein LEP1GSC137_2392 [Leptospira borgpetersenii str. Noumea 25]EMO63764.1 hypothetical protein LEP1GSC133_4646 [Leptospira borgpetersenii serovar Pomona str. 200901868]